MRDAPCYYRVTLALSLCLTLLGCGTIQQRRNLAQELATGSNPPSSETQSPEETYRVSFPDVVEIQVDGMRHLNGQYRLQADGRIDIPGLGRPRIEGDTAAGIARKIGDLLGLRPGQARCLVLEHRSRSVYVHGPVNGPARAVPYRGPETVVEFLRRIGGVKPGAKLDEIIVVRGNVAQGIPPETFSVDLNAILLQGDPTTNVTLEPFDVIYVGELARSRLGRALPDWMRPMYRGFCNTFPNACPQDWREQVRAPNRPGKAGASGE